MMDIRSSLSLRNVEDLLHERGIEERHETVWIARQRFGPMFAADIYERHVGQIRSSREALATARASLGEYVDNDVLDRATEAIQAEGARLVRVRRAVMLVEETLRGRIFLPRL